MFDIRNFSTWVLLFAVVAATDAQANPLKALLNTCHRVSNFGLDGKDIVNAYKRISTDFKSGTYTHKEDFKTVEDARHYVARASFSSEYYWLKYWLLHELEQIGHLHRTTWRTIPENIDLSVLIQEIKNKVNNHPVLDRVSLDREFRLPKEIIETHVGLPKSRINSPTPSLEIVETSTLPQSFKVWRSYDYILVVRLNPSGPATVSVYDLHQSPYKNDTRVETVQYLLNLLRQTSLSDWERVLNPD